MSLREIAFRPDLAAEILDEDKDATIRLDPATEYRPGRKYDLVTPDGERFATARVKTRSEAPLANVDHVLDILGATYPGSWKPAEVGDRLGDHYPDETPLSLDRRVTVVKLTDIRPDPDEIPDAVAWREGRTEDKP